MTGNNEQLMRYAKSPCLIMFDMVDDDSPLDC